MPATRLSGRVVKRLTQAEACESNPHYRDDLQIARLTVHYAATGEAVLCPPHVLASYAVLGLHPEKVWPAIEARRKALLGPLLEVLGAPQLWREKPPKKAAQSVKLWAEKTNGARAVNSRADTTLLRDNTISVPMAAPSIAALYRNPDEPSSAKTRQFTYDEMLDLVRHSYVRAAVRRATLNALTSRGMWPGEDGPATGTICVAFDAMALGDAEGDGMCSRRTAQRRAKLACDLGYWRLVHKFNRWLSCPECGAERTSAKCPNEKCGHKGRSRNRDGTTNTKEFCRPYTFEIDIEKFVKAEPPKYARHFCARTWKEHKAAAKRGEHPNVTEMPSPKPPESAPPSKSPAPARREEPQRKTAAIEERKPLTITREVRIAIAGCYSNARKQGRDESEALRETCATLSSDTRYLSESEARLQLKIWQTKNGSLEPSPQTHFAASAKCQKCGSVLVQNFGPGPRLKCPQCSADSS